MTTAYCIKGPDGEFYPLTVRITHAASVLTFQGMRLRPWKELKASGFKCVPVKLVEVENE